MSAIFDLPYSFCKRYGVITRAFEPGRGPVLVIREDTSAEAIIEAQRLLGVASAIETESDIEFNRLLSRHFEDNRETSFIEAERIGGELDLDEVARELSEPEDLLESDDDAPETPAKTFEVVVAPATDMYKRAVDVNVVFEGLERLGALEVEGDASEVPELASLDPAIVNRTMMVKEWEDRIVFLRRVVPGSADKSYGIHVARLAGLPEPVLERAGELLANLESHEYDLTGRPRIAGSAEEGGPPDQLNLFAPAEEVVAAVLKEVDLQQLTPLAALNLLHSLKSRLTGDS